MVNPSKRKGTSWETTCVVCLQGNGWPYAERRALSGSADRGDVAGVPGVVFECKNARTVNLGTWLDEATREAHNDKADVGVVWFKRRGKVDPLDGYVLMNGRTLIRLLHMAGYGS